MKPIQTVSLVLVTAQSMLLDVNLKVCFVPFV
jgi:hypothetical protein